MRESIRVDRQVRRRPLRRSPESAARGLHIFLRQENPPIEIVARELAHRTLAHRTLALDPSADQDKALRRAKKAIRDKKQATLNAQKDATQKLGEDLDAEHDKKQKAIGAKPDKTDAGIDPKAFFALIDKAQGDLLAIVKNPAGFFKNVGQALLGGFKRFTAHFVTHLEQGFVAWLTGALSAIDMPEHFDLMGVLSIARQVLGLSWDYLKDKAAQLIGQKNVERIEWVVEQLQTLIEGGWGALLAKIKDSLTGLKDEIFGKIEQFLVVNVVKTAIVKLAGLFSPVGAVIELVETLWNVYQTLKDQLARIFGVVKTVVDGLDDIVKGKLAPAEHKVESVLAGLLPTAIDLLARLIGLGGLGHKVEEFIKAVRARVDNAITALIKKIKAKFKSLFRRGKRGQKHGKTSPSDEKRHVKYANEAKIALQAPPKKPVDFKTFRKDKRAQANKLQKKYDRKLNKPVRMTIKFMGVSNKGGRRETIDFRVVVAPNTVNISGQVAEKVELPKAWATKIATMPAEAKGYATEKLLQNLNDLTAKSAKTPPWKQVRKWLIQNTAFQYFLKSNLRISKKTLEFVKSAAEKAVDKRAQEATLGVQSNPKVKLVRRSKPKIHKGEPAPPYQEARWALLDYLFGEKKNPELAVEQSYLDKANPDLPKIVPALTSNERELLNEFDKLTKALRTANQPPGWPGLRGNPQALKNQFLGSKGAGLFHFAKGFLTQIRQAVKYAKNVQKFAAGHRDAWPLLAGVEVRLRSNKQLHVDLTTYEAEAYFSLDRLRGVGFKDIHKTIREVKNWTGLQELLKSNPRTASDRLEGFESQLRRYLNEPHYRGVVVDWKGQIPPQISTIIAQLAAEFRTKRIRIQRI